jgi:hypothetical protein
LTPQMIKKIPATSNVNNMVLFIVTSFLFDRKTHRIVQ